MILPLFIVLIMLFSGIGFYYEGSDKEKKIDNLDSVEFKSKTFKKTNQGYSYKNVNFIYSPEELDNVTVTAKDFNFNGKIYFSVNQTVSNLISKIPFATQIIWASYDDNTSLKYDLPVKDCKDASQDVTVVKLISKEVNGVVEGGTSIRQEGRCYILEGDLNLAIERLTLEVLG